MHSVFFCNADDKQTDQLKQVLQVEKKKIMSVEIGNERVCNQSY